MKVGDLDEDGYLMNLPKLAGRVEGLVSDGRVVWDVKVVSKVSKREVKGLYSASEAT